MDAQNFEAIALARVEPLTNQNASIFLKLLPGTNNSES
jgi:hypothetical protein